MRTRWQVLAVVAFGLAVWAFLAVAAERHGYFDLKVYYGAINFWADGQGELYDFLLPKTEYGFTYPTFAALTMLPMAVVPWPVAIGIHLALSVAAVCALLYWLVDPVVRRHGWTRWFVFALALGLVAAFEPMRETVNFGQVNALLLALVAADLLLLVRRGHRFAGVGVGLATAIKLTPGIFIVYLLVCRRWRAAGVSIVAAAAATLLAAAVAPDASRIFWTDALWNTDRIGSQSFISNQSLNGFVARLSPEEPSRALWLALAAATFAVWVWRVRRAARLRDEHAGLALTGVVGALLSPITWIHHLVWLLPALILIVDRAIVPGVPTRRRRAMLVFAAAVYVLLCSRAVWPFAHHFTGWGVLGSNLYVYASVALLLLTPVGPVAAARAADPVEDGATAADGGGGADRDRERDGAAEPVGAAGAPARP